MCKVAKHFSSRAIDVGRHRCCLGSSFKIDEWRSPLYTGHPETEAVRPTLVPAWCPRFYPLVALWYPNSILVKAQMYIYMYRFYRSGAVATVTTSLCLFPPRCQLLLYRAHRGCRRVYRREAGRDVHLCATLALKLPYSLAFLVVGYAPLLEVFHLRRSVSTNVPTCTLCWNECMSVEEVSGDGLWHGAGDTYPLFSTVGLEVC